MTRQHLTALGVRLDVVVEDPSLARLTAGLMQDLRAPGPARSCDALVLVLGRGPWTVNSPAHSVLADTLPSVTSAVLAAVNLTAVQSTRLLAVHAAVLAQGERVLVLPAASGTGKSTLTACLLSRNWSYVSDEALCLRWDDGALVPYPRPVALSGWSASTAGVHGLSGHDGKSDEQILTARGCNWSVERHPGPVTDVVLLARNDRLPSLADVTRQGVVVELLRRSFSHFLDPARALTLLSAVAMGARCRQLNLGDPRAAAALLDP